MKKNKLILIASLIIIVAGLSFFYHKQHTSKKTSASKTSVSGDHMLSQTYDISKEYVELRARTDKVLTDAKDFDSYESWDTEMTGIIHAWQQMDDHAQFLGKVADKNSGDISFYKNLNLISPANAYSAQEISNVFDKAPAGKKIKTLAQFLGVDAKRAFKILKTDQEFVKADAWNEAGDTFKKLEASAVAIKDGCKVAGFVGGVVLSGGVAGIAAEGTALSQMAVTVGGADLVLEVGEDSAIISLGDNNKFSSFFGNARTITSPAASILGLVNIPGNLKTGFDKFSAVMFGADQIRGVVQENSILGISISSDGKIETASLNKDEVRDWAKKQKEGDWTAEDEKSLKELAGDYMDDKGIPVAEETKMVTVEENKNEKTSDDSVKPDDEKSGDAASSDEYSAKKVYGKNGVTYVSITDPEKKSLMVGHSMHLIAKIGDYTRTDDEDYQCYWTWYVNGEKMDKWEDLKGCGSISTVPSSWDSGVLTFKVRVEFFKTRYEPVGDYAPGEEITNYEKKIDVLDTITTERSYELLPMPVDTYQYGQ